MFEFIITNILGFTPDWAWPLLAITGIISWFTSSALSNFVVVKPYAAFIKPISILLTVLGIFMYGGSGIAAVYQNEIRAMQIKVAAAERQSKDVAKLLAEQQLQKQQLIEKKQIVYRDRIKQVEKRVDVECKFDKSALDILNSAATNPVKNQK
jgi:hypothetical protein